MTLDAGRILSHVWKQVLARSSNEVTVVSLILRLKIWISKIKINLDFFMRNSEQNAEKSFWEFNDIFIDSSKNDPNI